LYIICNYSKSELMYLYHHVVCILFLQEFPYINDSNLYYIYCIGEVSNFFTYVVYDFIKRDISKHIITKTKYVQVFWYIYFRVFCFTYHIFSKRDSYLKLNMYNQFGGFTIYLLGLVWTINQIKILV